MLCFKSLKLFRPEIEFPGIFLTSLVCLIFDILSLNGNSLKIHISTFLIRLFVNFPNETTEK
jgi:hypothetical protein